MSRLSEALLFTVNRWIPNPTRSLAEAKLDPDTYVAFFGRRAESSFAELGPIDWMEKNVLDVGSGLGVNLNFLSLKGPRSITAFDIDFPQLVCARSVHAQHELEYSSSVEFVAADAAYTPFSSESFDILVSADTFEHVNCLHETLAECCRLLRPGGRLYAFFPPYYAPWGAHMVNWLNLPWCQLFFSESTLLNVARRLENEGTAVNVHLPPRTRMDLGGGDVIPFISHLTLRHFRRVLRTIPAFKLVGMRLLPLGWRSSRWISRLLRLFTNIPLLQEIFTSRAVFILEKS